MKGKFSTLSGYRQYKLGPSVRDTSWQDEALPRNGVSREVPCYALKAKRSLTAFLRPPKVPQHAGYPRGEH